MGCITKTSVVFSVALVAVLVVFAVVVVQWKEGSDHRSASSSSAKNGVRGRINNDNNVTDLDLFNNTGSSKNTSGVPIGSNNSNKQGATAVCLVSVIDIEDDEQEGGVQLSKKEGNYNSDGEDRKDNDIIVCHRVSATSGSGVEDEVLLLQNLDIKAVRSNKEALANNEWYIEYSQDWVRKGRHGTDTIVIPEDHDVETIEPDRVPHHKSVSPEHRRQLSASLEERRRKLRAVGSRVVVVVSVDLRDTSKQQLYNHVFGNSSSLVSQMNDCSQGQLQIIPHSEYPVIEVKPARHISTYTFVDLYMEILQEARKELGLKNGRSLTSTTDHLLLVIPDDIDRRPGELGWGATPGFFSGIIESLAPSTMTMLHELGHNLGLGHAYEQGEAYGDMSTVMGYSHRDVVKMCYNGHNMWDMGWFEDRRYSIDFSNQNPNDREIVKLAWYGDYRKTASDEPVMLRYFDTYFTFNRAIGMNQETKEYRDMLLVVQEMPGDHHSHTNLVAALSPGSKAYEVEYQNKNRNAFIEVCSYTPGNNDQPDYLTISVGKQAGGCPHQSLTTTTFSNYFEGQGDRGVEIVSSQEFQPLECKMMFPWVELRRTSNPQDLDVDYVLCQAVASDPSRFCDQIDDTSQEEVWKICRPQCPQSGCVVENALIANTGTDESLLDNNSEEDAESKGDAMCEDLYSWVEVEIEDEYGNKEYVMKTCEELSIGLLETRQFYCSKYDTLTHLPVFEICRAGCPSDACSK